MEFGRAITMLQKDEEEDDSGLTFKKLLKKNRETKS